MQSSRDLKFASPPSGCITFQAIGYFGAALIGARRDLENGERPVDYLSGVWNRSNVMRACQHVACFAAAIFLAAEVWIVSSALGNRGTDLCTSRVTEDASESRAAKKPCTPKQALARYDGVGSELYTSKVIARVRASGQSWHPEI